MQHETKSDQRTTKPKRIPIKYYREVKNMIELFENGWMDAPLITDENDRKFVVLIWE